SGTSVNLLYAWFQTNGVAVRIPTAPNMTSYSSGINDSNQVIGYTQTTNVPYVQQIYYFDGATVTNIGTVNTNPPWYPYQSYPSLVLGINTYGQAAGTAYFPNPPPAGSRPFIYDPTNGLAFLGLPASSGWGLGSPVGINDAGQIIGTGVTFSN